MKCLAVKRKNVKRKAIQKVKAEETNKRRWEAQMPHFYNPHNAQIIHLDHQCLGELRLNYSSRQTVRKIINSRLNFFTHRLRFNIYFRYYI